MNLDDMAHFMLNEWTCMLTAPIDIEVICAKSQLKTGLLLSLNRFTAVIKDIGRQLITTGYHMISKQIKSAADAMTTEKIKQVAHKCLWDNGVTSTLL